MAAQNSRRAPTSMPAVGSSRTSRSGSGSRASAKRSRCCSPPEHLETFRRANPAAPARPRASSTGSGSRCRVATIATVSRTDRSSSSPPVCRTAPIRPARTLSRGVAPRVRTVPSSGSVKPRTMSRRVVLPAPLGPSSATTSPRSMRMLTPSTARTRCSPRPKPLWTPETSTAGEPSVGSAGLGCGDVREAGKDVMLRLCSTARRPGSSTGHDTPTTSATGPGGGTACRPRAR